VQDGARDGEALDHPPRQLRDGVVGAPLHADGLEHGRDACLGRSDPVQAAGSALPSTRTSPACGRSSVASMRNSVVLPAPLGPKTTSVRPAGRSSVTSRSAARSP